MTYVIAGTAVAMPVQVRDATAGTVLYDVEAEALQALVPDAFAVVESAPGRANLALALVDYRDNDLGAYREVGIVAFVRPRAGGDEGNFIVHLPVDEEFSCEAGRRIWGFPKTVARIDRTDDGERSTWVLEMDGELVLRVTLPRGGSDEAPQLSMTSYTLLEGRPHATAFAQWGSGAQLVVGAEAVELELGGHAVANQLRSLGLPSPAVLSSWTERMQGTFETPRPL